MSIFLKQARKRRKGGYILLLAVLISSIILAISLGVYSIGLKQFVLSSFLSESQKALVAADRGIECYMYWDGLFRDNGLQDNAGNTSVTTNTMFPQPLGSTPQSSDFNPPNWPPANAGNASMAVCAGNHFYQSGTWGAPQIVTDSTGTWIQTSYRLDFGDGSYTTVRVRRSNNFTQIIANGYNTKDQNSLRQTMRQVEVDARI